MQLQIARQDQASRQLHAENLQQQIARQVAEMQHQQQRDMNWQRLPEQSEEVDRLRLLEEQIHKLEQLRQMEPSLSPLEPVREEQEQELELELARDQLSPGFPRQDSDQFISRQDSEQFSTHQLEASVSTHQLEASVSTHQLEASVSSSVFLASQADPMLESKSEISDFSTRSLIISPSPADFDHTQLHLEEIQRQQRLEFQELQKRWQREQEQLQQQLQAKLSLRQDLQDLPAGAWPQAHENIGPMRSQQPDSVQQQLQTMQPSNDAMPQTLHEQVGQQVGHLVRERLQQLQEQPQEEQCLAGLQRQQSETHLPELPERQLNANVPSSPTRATSRSVSPPRPAAVPQLKLPQRLGQADRPENHPGDGSVSLASVDALLRRLRQAQVSEAGRYRNQMESWSQFDRRCKDLEARLLRHKISCSLQN